jgi:hypothetical protein
VGCLDPFYRKRKSIPAIPIYVRFADDPSDEEESQAEEVSQRHQVNQDSVNNVTCAAKIEILCEEDGNEAEMIDEADDVTTRLNFFGNMKMYIDLEGVDLCRDGSLSILTLPIHTGIPTMHVCLIDMHLLGSQAFNTTGIKQMTLKDILQDEKIPKVIFGDRNDSDALFALFGVTL